jgi:lipopolysaccharide transport system permease protein
MRGQASAVDERTSDDAIAAGDSVATAGTGEVSTGGVGEREAVGRVNVIRPAPRWPHLDVPELWHFRELLGTLVWRDVAVRYKQTFLGVAWAILVPIFTAAVYVIVFGKFANFPAGSTPYVSLVIAGVLPMQYFASALTGSGMSLAANLPLVTKVYFPRTLLPLAAVIVPIVDFVVGLPVLVALMWHEDTWPAGWEVATAPLFLSLAVLTALGAGLFLSAANVRYRDVRYMIPVLLQVMPLLSGVMYDVSQIPEKWQWILAFNPMTAVIAGWRWAVLDASTPNLGQTALGFAMGFAIFLVGLAVFRSSEPRFADTI